MENDKAIGEPPNGVESRRQAKGRQKAESSLQNQEDKKKDLRKKKKVVRI
ncbi:MAG: hypothetical protein GQ561_03325 [Calditrichae bacterium]|nr:hypothetical protein [Calditrichia bacterium]